MLNKTIIYSDYIKGDSKLSFPDWKALHDLRSKLNNAANTLLGIQINLKFNYKEILPFLDLSINNVGDPFADTIVGTNTYEIEKQVISDFAKLFNFNGDNFWGYVNNGGSEGNLFALRLAKKMYPNSIVYYSRESHYSAAKALDIMETKDTYMKNLSNFLINYFHAHPNKQIDLLEITNFIQGEFNKLSNDLAKSDYDLNNIIKTSTEVNSLQNGEIDYDDFKKHLQENKHVVPIIFLTAGTSVKCAIDNVKKINKILEKLRIDKYYIHMDGALAAGYLPFVKNAPIIDFRAGIHSISVSGHKFFGSPLPCGVVITNKNYISQISKKIEYVDIKDTTITGSRNALTPLFLWYAFRTVGISGFTEWANESIRLAEYTTQQLENHGVKAWRSNPFSIAPLFPRPGMKLRRKYSISSVTDEIFGPIAHIFTMPHVTKDMIDQFIEAYIKDPEIVKISRKKSG